MRNKHSRIKEPMVNMKLFLALLLVAASYAYTPINKRSWITFRKVKDPTYNTAPIHEEPNIIHATHIDIEEWISALSTLVWKSLRGFHEHMKKYTAEVTKRVK